MRITRLQSCEVQPVLQAWREKHGLEGSLIVEPGGQSLDGDRPPENDKILLLMDTTAEQVNELAANISQTLSVATYLRPAEMKAIPVLSMKTMQPTGEVQWVEVGTPEQPQKPEKRQLN